MACPAITAEVLLPSKHLYKQPDPVLYLLNMFPKQGTRDQIQLVTLERKLAVCVQRQLCLLFSSHAPSPHLSQDEAFFPKQFSKSKKLIAKLVMCMRTLGRGNNNKVNATLPILCGYIIKRQTAVSCRAMRGLGRQLHTHRCPRAPSRWWGGCGEREHPSRFQKALTQAASGPILSVSSLELGLHL